jgi:hypothetical protein
MIWLLAFLVQRAALMKSFRTLSLLCVILLTIHASFAYEIGDVVDDFTLPSLDGDTISLSDYSGQVVLINFWAPW